MRRRDPDTLPGTRGSGDLFGLLRLEVEATKVRETMGRVNCLAKVGDQVAAEATMVFTLVDAG